MTLVALVLLIGGFNLLTFGNGPALVPLLQEHLVVQRGVLTADQLLYAFAIARVTPGQANLYVASVGYFIAGPIGAVATTAAIALPSYIVIPLVAVHERIRHNRFVAGFTRGLTSTSVGLILGATLSIGGRSLTEPIGFVVFAAALVLLVPLRWGSLRSIAAAAALGLLLLYLRG